MSRRLMSKDLKEKKSTPLGFEFLTETSANFG